MFATLLSFCGCQGAFFDPDKIEYTIYSSSTEGLATKSEKQEGNSTLQFASASDLGLHFNIQATESENPDAPKTKSFAFKDRSVELPYLHSKTLQSANSTQSTLKSYSVIDVYKDDNTLMRFRHQTDELIEYFEFDQSIRNASGEYTKDDAEELAIQLFITLYGEKVLSEYELESVTEQSNESGSLLCVTYTRYLYGYPTEDELRVKFNRKGELVFLNADYMGCYQHLNKQISKKQIEYAENLLRNSISSSWTVGDDALLVLDANGSCYVRLIATNKDANGVVEGEYFYINID